MEKKKKWPFFLILITIALTLYNILPTVFYYANPLSTEVSPSKTSSLVNGVVQRVSQFEKESSAWVLSFCDLLHLKPQTLSQEKGDLLLTFKTREEADRFRKHFPASPPFCPIPLALLKEEGSSQVTLHKGVHALKQEDFLTFTKEHPLFASLAPKEASSLVAIDLRLIAAHQIESIRSVIENKWAPKHPDLASLQIVSQKEFDALPPEKKVFCIVVNSPLLEENPSLEKSSLYLSLHGMERIVKSYENHKKSELARIFSEDLQELSSLLEADGFFPFKRSNGEMGFEKRFFFDPLLKATKEDFLLSFPYAILPLSTVEKRILTENKIETKLHEDLIKWSDAYYAAKIDPSQKIPKPTKNIFLSNALLSFRKYFRGDERKVLKWGLDLSGGKTVEIELHDPSGKPIVDPEDLQLGINELYERVNRFGLSEVSIRLLGEHIVVDFPGSQALSAKELIQPATLRFHVVNEKFSNHNPPLREAVSQFLQQVWEEALHLGKLDSQSVHKIAYEQLHTRDARSDQALFLVKEGLNLTDPKQALEQGFDERLSRVVVLRGDAEEKFESRHSLMIVFNSSALEGKSLKNIRSQYDPTKGNFLSFDVEEGKARDLLYTWTSRFSKESVVGTPLELLTRGGGFRMAVLFNDAVLNAPTLDSPLKESAMISGKFSQNEILKLTHDLKSGSLTFTPHILSEKNVSPELGSKERMQGIVATIIAFLLVILSMIGYYRFAGLVASVAVFFNLLILWGVLQNLGATLTLAGIAGIILTVGMAVDANVLVFERFREEFAKTQSLSSSISAGYKKAFSAILDSNVTTLIAAFILLNFDAGPIKSFAINLMIGIASSMFTALFMTRVYFESWAKRSKSKVLKMADWFHSFHFDFLKMKKFAFISAFLIIGVGSCLIYSSRSSIFGMDFTGGYATTLETEAAAPVEEALLQAGLSHQDFQVRTLSSDSLRLFLGTSSEGKIPLNKDSVLDTLKRSGVSLQEGSGMDWTAVSGQISGSMRNHALIGLLLSFIAIFIYLSFRFEYKFAMAALLCLVHDVLITLGLVGILSWMKVPLQIDLNTIAALMTIVGYSLNDTIIIFDRIREEMNLSPHKNLSLTINQALNSTLSRTTITSGTTLLVLLALVIFGGASIFSFSFVMTLGVLFGTLSSWLIASPLLLFFHKRESSEKVIHIS